MSLHGITKGTPLEKMAEMMALGEAKGTMMYYTLARLAKEQGLDDVAEQFIEAANQEAVHAGFYATVNGMLPKDFWQLVRGLMSAETSGEKKVKAMADKFREAGLAEAADEMEVFAKPPWRYAGENSGKALPGPVGGCRQENLCLLGLRL